MTAASLGSGSVADTTRSRSRRWVGWVLGAIVILVLVNLVLSVVNTTSGDTARRGPDGSSYVTTARGLAAFESLASAYGYDTSRSREVAGASLESGDTAVVWDPDPRLIDQRTGDRLSRFVEDGGRLVIATTPTVLTALFDVGLPLDTESGDTYSGIVTAPSRRFPARPGPPETEGVTDVLAADASAFVPGAEGTTVLGTGAAAAAATYPLGRGTIVYVVAPSVLENRLLDRADNARFGLGALGPTSRPVVFVERVHGYEDEGEGIDAVPTGWKIALAGILVGGLLVILAAGRRVGPPEDLARALPPPRDAYVRALAVSLANSGQPESTFAPTQEIMRRRLARNARLPEDARIDELRSAAEVLGWPRAEIDALFEPINTNARAVALSRAAARLAGTGSRTSTGSGGTT